jgi:hypothetical protein
MDWFCGDVARLSVITLFAISDSISRGTYAVKDLYQRRDQIRVEAIPRAGRSGGGKNADGSVQVGYISN